MRTVLLCDGRQAKAIADGFDKVDQARVKKYGIAEKGTGYVIVEWSDVVTEHQLRALFRPHAQIHDYIRVDQ